MSNPLLSPWDTPFALPPFAAITDDHFAPPSTRHWMAAGANIAAIAGNPDAPTFANTIEALELAEETSIACRACSTTCRARNRTPRARR
jgi:peptidyl-dipeptidase Dcp